LAAITSWYQTQIDANALPGAVVAIARNGKLAYLEALGTQDQDKEIPLKSDAIFWIASMTKPITSVAAMILVDEGKLDLTAPVYQYLPELRHMQVAVPLPGKNELSFQPQKRPMHVLDLLHHTAGLVYGEEYGATAVHRLYDGLYGKDGVWRRDRTLADFITALAKLPLAHQPGEVWEYSHAVDVLARVVEVASGSQAGALGRFPARWATARMGRHQADQAFLGRWWPGIDRGGLSALLPDAAQRR
jgi:CubicO group peptidase (beta-lactamase class C family)